MQAPPERCGPLWHGQPRRAGPTLAPLMHTPTEPRVRLVLSTCPDAQTADALATALVDERLAACVNMLPGVRSIYRWKGAVERGEEVLLLIKTTADRQDELFARLKTLHPYELPEAVAVEAVGGLAAYLDWVSAETQVARNAG